MNGFLIQRIKLFGKIMKTADHITKETLHIRPGPILRKDAMRAKMVHHIVVSRMLEREDVSMLLV